MTRRHDHDKRANRRAYKPPPAPHIGHDFAHDDGPQTRGISAGRSVMAWCYLHDLPHSYADCPGTER